MKVKTIARALRRAEVGMLWWYNGLNTYPGSTDELVVDIHQRFRVTVTLEMVYGVQYLVEVRERQGSYYWQFSTWITDKDRPLKLLSLETYNINVRIRSIKGS